MGYYTAFKLHIENGDNSIIPEFRKEFEGAEWAITDDGSYNDNAKWYSFEEDLCKFSIKHPNVIFVLHGEGEEPRDLWVCYAKNGKSHYEKAEIVYPDFDESKLKKIGII